jgi:Tfp pilus assembly protein FimV
MYCGPDTGNVNIWLAEDLRAWGEACATAHASDLAQRVEELERQLAEAKDEIRVSDQLLTHRQQLLEAIHECPAHGPCVPHALEWVEKAKAFERDLAAMTTARDVAVELGATYAARADELRADAERYRKLRARLNSANFYPEQMDLPPGVALIFILPKGSAVSGNLDKTIDAIEDEVKHG